MATEVEIQEHKLDEERKRYSYELVQKLTYFVITAEFVFCGYMLQNAEKLKELAFAVLIYSGVGIAGICGLMWRFCYNITYHDRVHRNFSKIYKIANYLQHIFHNVFVILSIVTLIWALAAGAIYLQGIINAAK